MRIQLNPPFKHVVSSMMSRLVIPVLCVVFQISVLDAAAHAQDPAATSDVGANASATDASTPDSSEPQGSGNGSSSRLKKQEMAKEKIVEEKVVPWDYSPYRVLIWVATDDPRISVAKLEQPVRDFLDRDFSSIWRLTVQTTPYSMRSIMQRELGNIDYDMLTGADPVFAVKKNHPDAVRIQTVQNIAKLIKKVHAADSGIESLVERGKQNGDATVAGVAERFESVGNNLVDVVNQWAQESTEAVLLPRGMAVTLDEPKPKLVKPPINGLVADVIENFDKVYLVNVKSSDTNPRVEVVEIDVLMRYFGRLVSTPLSAGSGLGETIGRTLTKAFSPVVRIDDAGTKTAAGLLRAGGLVIDNDSPALIREGDVLRPMSRKNDRNGVPFLIGPIDWAYLVADKIEGNSVAMDYYSGRAGGLQGRKNKRTFRTAIKVQTDKGETTLRLHAQGKPNSPLIGYEIYQKELKSKSMKFIGRTDWNGRLKVEKTDDPLRLLYVKNGGAILARLPLVPGLSETATADLRGDDLRLQAEAYIRGVQNSIIDLVAVRELFKARILLRLQRGELDKAKTLMVTLRDQPNNEALADDMGKKQAVFIKLLEKEGANQRRKVDQMFKVTRDLLTKHINPRVIRELEGNIIKAEENGGRLPAQNSDDE